MKQDIIIRIAACAMPCVLAATGIGTLPVSAHEEAVSAPVFSQESGFYAEPFDLTLTAPDGCLIYYTLDGSNPTAESQHYDKPISVYDRTPEANVHAETASPFNPPKEPVDKAMVVRAAAYDEAGNLSEIVTKTYFIGYEQSNYLMKIPVISLVTDPDNLFNEETGIYVRGNSGLSNFMKKGKEWERPANFTVFEGGKEVYFANTGIRIHGYSSTQNEQKSFKLYSRNEYGTKKFEYDFFHGNAKDAAGESITSFNHMILRNGGNDEILKIRDRLNQEMAAGRSFGTQEQTECVVFLDGEFWGLYNITEKLNESYVAAHYHVKKDSVCLIKDPLEFIEGEVKGLDDFRELVALADSDLSGEDSYECVADVIDMNSFEEYMATELIITNMDFNNNNFALWKTDTVDSSNPYADGKWRFLLYDTEHGQGMSTLCNADKDMFDWMHGVRSWNFQLLFSLLENSPRFRTEFAQAYISLCNENFNPDRVLNRLEELRPSYQDALAESFDRFQRSQNDDDAEEDTDTESVLEAEFDKLRTFWESRADYAKAHLASYLQTVIMPGDVNGDAQTNAEDAALLRDYLLGKPDTALPEAAAGDLNTDGRLDAADLTLLKQMLLP